MMVSHDVSQTDDLPHVADYPTTDRARYLRRVLVGNALFSALSGLLFLLGTEAVLRFLGLQGASLTNLFLFLGAGLLTWAGWCAWASTRVPLQRYQVMSIIAGDLLWLFGSILLLMGGWLPLTVHGQWAIGIVADIVALFAILQFIGWRHANG